MANCYDILEIAQSASEEIIHMAYHALARKYDPSTYPGDKDYAEYKTKALNKAYRILSDPETRKKYDLYLQSKQATTTTSLNSIETESISATQSVPSEGDTPCDTNVDYTDEMRSTHDFDVEKDRRSSDELLVQKVTLDTDSEAPQKGEKPSGKHPKPPVLMILLACAAALFLFSLSFYCTLRIVMKSRNTHITDTPSMSTYVPDEELTIASDTESNSDIEDSSSVAETEAVSLYKSNYIQRARVVAEKEYSKYLENEEIRNFMQKAFANNITMDMLNRQPSYYLGKEVYFGGHVLQAIYTPDNHNEVELRIEVKTVASDQDVVYVTYTLQHNETRILEGDYVDMYGIFCGMFTYNSVGGGPITIPKIEGRKIYCYANVEGPLTTPTMDEFKALVSGNFWSDDGAVFSFATLPNTEMNYFSDATDYGDCIVAYYIPEIGWDANNPPPFYRVTAFDDRTMVIFEPYPNAAEGTYAIDEGTYTEYTFLNNGDSAKTEHLQTPQTNSSNATNSIATSQTGYVLESSGGLKIRSGPSANYEEVGRLAPLESIAITEIQSDGSRDWGKIDRGWVCMDYIVIGSAPVCSSGGGYTAVLDQYRTALATNFATCGQYVGESFAYLSSWGAKFEVYYATVDLNRDGVSELIIGGKEQASSSIENMDLFTLSGDTPSRLVDTSTLAHRAHLYIYPDGTFATSGSGGASTHMTEFYKLPSHSGSASITHGYGTDMGTPYYYGADGNPYTISENELYALPDASQLPQMNISWTRLN